MKPQIGIRIKMWKELTLPGGDKGLSKNIFLPEVQKEEATINGTAT